MSRNKIEMSTDIFQKIHDSASAQDSTYIADNKKRWLVRKDDEDLNLMINAEVNVLILGAKTFAVSIKNGSDKYFCFSGLDIPEQLPVNLTEIEPTPGIFSCVVFTVNLPALATAAEARDILEQQYHGQEGYVGHELNEIAPLFPKLYFVKANENINTTYLNNLERVAGAYIAAGYVSHPLEVNGNLKSRLLSLFEAGAETIPFGLPLQGLLSYNWPSLFLDLYRCLEQLYTALKLKNLVTKLPYKGALADLAYLLEDELSWRPKEQDALASILAHSTENTRSKILSAFKFNVSELTEYSPSKCASNIYKLRNSHVHFRPAMKAENKSAEQWNEIVIAMCDAVDDVYEALGVEFLIDRSSLESVR
ncbi:hypothetical protein NJH77_06815 [Serratia fonticola]|uniref:hypothetical protein n=1 Tax=Serratia fonticola TaxID=47917 RepID=UPI00209787BD|nr:hypothetical protein [Serratia fonticola]MCO7508963.1 hypothetical protein [Serratia fonticola]